MGSPERKGARPGRIGIIWQIYNAPTVPPIAGVSWWASAPSSNVVHEWGAGGALAAVDWLPAVHSWAAAVLLAAGADWLAVVSW